MLAPGLRPGGFILNVGIPRLHPNPKEDEMTSLSKLPGMYGVLEDIHVERRRQIEEEGWTPQHDDNEHAGGELAIAAGWYALNEPSHLFSDWVGVAETMRPFSAPYGAYRWPWDMKWWKPTSARRDLVKAAALIVAEIERLDRTVNVSKPAAA